MINDKLSKILNIKLWIISISDADSINLNTPVVPLAHAAGSRFMVDGQRQVLEDMHDAIAVATGDLGLLPGVAFQGRVAQLANLNAAHQTVWALFFLFDLIVYFICKITSKGHNIKLPGYMITSMFIYRQYEFFFFKIGYTEHHLCFIWNIYTWTCIYIKNIFIINLSFISDICGWTSRMWKERVHQNVWIFWERAW